MRCDAARAPALPGLPRRQYDLVGPLCTSIDRLAHGVELPELAAGDLVGIGCSGAYGPTASPVNFIRHDPPKEILVETRDGREYSFDTSSEEAALPLRSIR